jgi:hypothetical protein
MNKKVSIKNFQVPFPKCVLYSTEKARADQKLTNERMHASVWGVEQHKDFKFCLFGAVKRFEGQSPHPFAARELLRTLATDPGIVGVMIKNELTVGKLEEMDPDDRLAAVTQSQRGGCLLGYNQNGGQAIYIRLRREDGGSFRPYEELIDTLLHELSHNIMGPHNMLFWGTFAKLKAEYLLTRLAMTTHPHRFPCPKPRAPVAETVKDTADCEARVARKLHLEASSNMALSPSERAECAQVFGCFGLPVLMSPLHHVHFKYPKLFEQLLFRMADVRNTNSTIILLFLGCKRDGITDDTGFCTASCYRYRCYRPGFIFWREAFGE